MASSSSSSSNSPCAACKFLRRKCTVECVFAPYFPPDQPHKFANVHKIFGASNVTKLLNELHPHQREDAVNSLAYEAEARVKDPVYGCVGTISVLHQQVRQLQSELQSARSELSRYINVGIAISPMPTPSSPLGIGMGLAGTSRDQIFRDHSIMEPPVSRDHHLLRANFEQVEIARIHTGPTYDTNYLPLAIAGGSHSHLGLSGGGNPSPLNQYHPRTPASSNERNLVHPYFHSDRREE
ncbi:hypothetical protein SUGI_0843170 [Cryptomeria japonica]|uniref:protein LATERAL ORGAN BOUNDARIES n=1 Tax=Cryptomeria japonica TaxID=3369 RepID=UPI002414CD64|nr:protein LATERAL ORGAN BOUNDARIES [Cryptomeria japonica]XP_057843188.1 protein LATERAL ORGAN BOUNDARIES [Cryptomeria japonica]XP_057843197.1 protein LATERAL ORGAN BOUNDARIES [Cryptomeria japonica]XP_059065963.1 protein LATERAL ORGAN BOUNDARIES [Cryptomeria japonica]GLJ40774.1 hypothetical protein SUGI_0843170 [Cryptomeria japonica]